MNGNMAKLLARLETTKIPTVTGTLRQVRGEEVCMCPLGHLVDIWIDQNEGAHWVEDSDYYSVPAEDLNQGFPSDDILAEFGLDYDGAVKIYRRNDSGHLSPVEVAAFIRAELI